MKKRFTLLLLILSIAFCFVSAQVNLNVNSGVGISLIENRNEGDTYLISPIIGVESSLIKINSIVSLGTGISYLSQGYKNKNQRELVVHYLSIPLFLKAVHKNGIINLVGISYTGLISSKETFVPVIRDNEIVNGIAELKNGHLSLMANVGYQFKNNITTGLRWQFDITNITHNLDYKYQSFHLVLGYNFNF